MSQWYINSLYRKTTHTLPVSHFYINAREKREASLRVATTATTTFSSLLINMEQCDNVITEKVFFHVETIAVEGGSFACLLCFGRGVKHGGHWREHS